MKVYKVFGGMLTNKTLLKGAVFQRLKTSDKKNYLTRHGRINSLGSNVTNEMIYDNRMRIDKDDYDTQSKYNYRSRFK